MNEDLNQIDKDVAKLINGNRTVKSIKDELAVKNIDDYY